MKLSSGDRSFGYLAAPIMMWVGGTTLNHFMGKIGSGPSFVIALIGSFAIGHVPLPPLQKDKMSGAKYRKGTHLLAYLFLVLSIGVLLSQSLQSYWLREKMLLVIISMTGLLCGYLKQMGDRIVDRTGT